MEKLLSQLNQIGHIEYITKGYSMLPLLSDGSIVKIVKSDTYNIFDVVLYNFNDQLVLHRIINIKGDDYYIKGDNYAYIDIVKKDKIYGVLQGFYYQNDYICVESEQYKEYINSYLKKNNTNLIIDSAQYKIFNAYQEVFRYLFNKEIDTNIFAKLNKEEFAGLVAYCYQNKCAHVLAEIVNNYSIKIDQDIKSQLDKYLDIAKADHIRKEFAKEQISSLLKKHKIKHLYLKWGEVSKDYIRSANDIDIYVDYSDLDNVKSILEKECKGKFLSNTNDIHLSYLLESYGVHLEVHYKLLDDCFDDINNLFNNPFSKAYEDKNNDYLYHLEKEYYFIFNLAHIGKHVLYFELFFNMIYDYINLNNEKYDGNLLSKLLKESKLQQFKIFLDQYVSFLVKNRLPSFEDILLVKAISINKIEKEVNNSKRIYKSRISYILHRIFISYEELCHLYPKLKGKKLLTPFYQLKRWCNRISNHGLAKAKNEMSHFNNVLSKEETGLLFFYIGLDTLNSKIK